VSAFTEKSTTIQKKIQTLTTQVRNSCAIVTHRAEVVEVAGPSQHPANLTKVASRSSLCKMAIESVLDAQIALGHNVHNFAEEPKAIRILLVVGLVVSGCFWILRNDSNVPFVLFFWNLWFQDVPSFRKSAGAGGRGKGPQGEDRRAGLGPWFRRLRCL
jgi:hypothetical protein